MTETTFMLVQNIYEYVLIAMYMGIALALFNIFVPKNTVSDRKLIALIVSLVIERITVSAIPHDFKGTFFIAAFITIIAFFTKEKGQVQALFLYLFFLWQSVFSVCFMFGQLVSDVISDRLLTGVNYSIPSPMESVYMRLAIWLLIMTFIYFVEIVLELVIIKLIVKKKYLMTMRQAVFMSAYSLVALILMYMFTELAVVPVGSEVFVFTDQNMGMRVKQPIIALLLYLGQLGGLVLWQEFQALKEREIENQKIISQMEYGKRYIDDLKEYHTKIRILKHDMAGKLTALRGLMETEPKDEVLKYLSKMDIELNADRVDSISENPIIDIILREKLAIAKPLGIDIELGFDAHDIDEAAYDIGIVLSNLIDNAIEEYSQVPKENPYINIKCFTKDNFFVAEIQNTRRNHEVTLTNGLPSSSKPGDHGLGLKSVKQIADKYNGTLSVKVEDNLFIARVMLQL